MMDMTDGRPHNNHVDVGDDCYCDRSSGYYGDHHCHCPPKVDWPGYRLKPWAPQDDRRYYHNIYYLDGQQPYTTQGVQDYDYDWE
ncbi:unnamed protein product [Adineta steineri]|uniref:Uncharacterized protein n=1 Tax=Adineta steineri TaxID=433720 RepID=A0A814Q213_9BILA|nr:unnamed protein product [Adineta steineri]CAF1113576.1 unnamed protein product [Adineta steineri]